MAQPLKTLELHYPVIRFLIKKGKADTRVNTSLIERSYDRCLYIYDEEFPCNID